jgi:DNA mismatch endonuclease (patch repair protein)
MADEGKPTDIKRKYVRDGRAPIPVKEATSRVMSANKGIDTRPELVLRKAIYKEGLRGYRLHWKKAPGRPDIAFPRKKVAIFVNGCFWHRCPYCRPSVPKTNVEFWTAKFERNRERDIRERKELRDNRWKVVTIWECQIKKDLAGCVERVRKQVNPGYPRSTVP